MNENAVKRKEPAENISNEIRRSRSQGEKENKNSDYLTRMIIIQFVMCLAFVGILFALNKWGGNSFAELKKEYNEICSHDMTAGEMWSEIKSAAGFVFKKEETNKKYSEGKKKLGMGGDDKAVYASIDTALLSPFLVSSPICNPVSGEISSSFGYRVNPISGEWSFHSGTDIAADEGDTIRAAYYGTVTEAGTGDAEGNYAVISHSRGLVTKYFHCSKLLVKEGTVVRQGEAIALVGSTGNSTGPHLHFTMEIDGKKVDPQYILKTNDGWVL